MALNHKLQTFVDVWAGKVHEAAQIAGISEQYGRLLMVSLDSPSARPLAREVQNAIRQRESTRIAPDVMNRLDRQRFWTDQVKKESNTLSDRLRASELLGKSEADFIDVVKSEHTMRLQLGAPRVAVEARTLPDAPVGQAKDDSSTEDSTDDKGDTVV